MKLVGRCYDCGRGLGVDGKHHKAQMTTCKGNPSIPASEVEALRDEIMHDIPKDNQGGFERGCAYAGELIDALLARHGKGGGK